MNADIRPPAGLWLITCHLSLVTFLALRPCCSSFIIHPGLDAPPLPRENREATGEACWRFWMARTRYSESRTIVRRLRRLPDESREQFKSKVLRLRRQFEEFNVNVSELCQWAMSLRPGGKQGNEATKQFWEFFLESDDFTANEDPSEADRCRRKVFDIASGLDAESSIEDTALSESLVQSIHAVAKVPLTPTATKLFQRLAGLHVSHRQVLVKAAAEWIIAHYLRGYQNWERQREEWEKEKTEWEGRHLTLTESVRNDFNATFKELNIRIKRPRVCTWERLKTGKDNCEWAGERIRVGGLWKSHSALCVKYREFLEGYGRESGEAKSIKRYFVENAKAYMGLRRTSRGTRDISMNRLLRQQPNARWFPGAWEAYLKMLGVTEQTVLAGGHELPHCVEFGAERDCSHNKHTNECEEYRRILENRPDLQSFENLYREWRAEYFAGAAKPCFQYPSSRGLPMPKIFGEGYFRVDAVNSVVDLRLEDGEAGQFERFRFAPWPTDYEPKARDVDITSVHVNFAGPRARVGFRFEVHHKESRLGVTQDEIDELRSRQYPRRAQDVQFLEEARKRLLDSFEGNAEYQLRILAVDLGTEGGGAIVFEGRNFKKAEPLKLVKIDRLYDARPKEEKAGNEKVSDRGKEKAREKGLGKEHVRRHLASWAVGASLIARKRGIDATGLGPPELGEYDMRRLSSHVRWMIRDWVRLNASQIIDAAERNNVDLIVLESMRGFKAPGYDKLDEEKKRRMGFFAHGRIRRKVREKAVERGMRVVTVPYLGSSQMCAVCGKQQEDKDLLRKNKGRRAFVCEKCGHKGHSDENAARVLARVFWGEVTLPEKS
jgi:transposase